MARTGTGTVLSGNKTHVVTAAGTATNSQVSVMFTSNPSSTSGGALVEWIEKENGVGFTIHLSNPVQADSTFDYLLS
jgi:hypothetical protein